MKTASLPRVSYPAINPGTTQTLTVGAASVATSTPPGADLVRLVSTVACYIAIGATPTATATSMYLPANLPEYFVTNRTDNIAVLEVSTSGTLFITPAD